MGILWAFVWFAVIGAILGILLAFFSRFFAVKESERVKQIREVLPGANCGGCGFASCQALAEAIDAGEAKTNSCRACDPSVITKISDIMGVEPPENTVRMRAQVMCSGTYEAAHTKYVYEGPRDCAAIVKLGGGNKLCLNGCIGFGTCVTKCNFHAIKVVNGVAQIDYDKCVGCGSCVAACPKHIIKLIPYNSVYWVGCMSVDNGKITRLNCDAGCIGCKICEKNCEAGAIKIDNGVASIDYNKCVGCGICAAKCPRKIIRTGKPELYTEKVIDNLLEKEKVKQ